MKIVVTGGAGFIGSHVADACIEAGHEVVVLDDLSRGDRRNLHPKARFYEIDICDPKVREVFLKERPDVLNHHAAQISVSDSVKDPVRDAQINILGMLNLLEAAAVAGTRKVIFASSGGAMYGEIEGRPAGEESPRFPISPYAVSKIAGEFYLGYYRRQHGIRYTSLRYANVYGPRQSPHGEAGAVAIFSTMTLSGKAPRLFAARQVGDAGDIRDYVYVGDVVRANTIALERGDDDVFNIATATETTTVDLYRAVAGAVEFRDPPEFSPPRPGDLLRSVISYQKAERVLGWRPETSLSEGIRKTVEYFRKQSAVSGQP
jgi:UDP-glucose 4-epimerase